MIIRLQRMGKGDNRLCQIPTVTKLGSSSVSCVWLSSCRHKLSADGAGVCQKPRLPRNRRHRHFPSQRSRPFDALQQIVHWNHCPEGFSMGSNCMRPASILLLHGPTWYVHMYVSYQ